MSLVNREQDRSQLGHSCQDVGVGELLGREEHEVGTPVRAGELLEDLLSMAGRITRVEDDGGQLGPMLQRSRLVALQSDERRDHNGRAGEHGPGHLVDRGLAGARRQNREGVPPVQHALDGLALARPK
jgi:hypothetical protein